MNLKLSEVVKAAGPSTEDPAKVRVQIDRPGEESASTTLAELISGAVDDIVIRQGDVVTVSVLP
jgi:protein involved in polysaccharide export with SLBB domain